MDSKQYGGVGAKEVIVFQTKILMGAQFGRIMWAKEHKTESLCNSQKEILIACLRNGWSDAFRHTSENEDGINDFDGIKGAVSTYEKKDVYKTPLLKIFRKKIKEEQASSDFDDYFCARVISDDRFINIFKEYAACATDKWDIIDYHWQDIIACFRGVKKLDGNKKLSFGHIQKMFNMAIKLYLCLYICREELDLDDDLFIKVIVDNFDNADCPIDSIILGRLEQIEMKRAGLGMTYTPKYEGYTWSQLNSNDYRAVQRNIRTESDGKSNLWFDFFHWN